MGSWKTTKVLVTAALVVALVAIVGLFMMSAEEGVVVKFDSDGSWAGVISDDDGNRAVSGDGTESFRVSDQGSIRATGTMISPGTLTVSIIVDGQTVAERTTSVPGMPVIVSADV